MHTKDELVLLMRKHAVEAFRHYDVNRCGWFTVSQSKVRDDCYLDIDYIYQCVINHLNGIRET
jgi:hypothetical protein